jgi:toxin YoeB
MCHFNIDTQFFEDISKLKTENAKLSGKVWELVECISNNISTPLNGLGKPEFLKGQLAGCYSRRITDKHRVIYRIDTKNEIIHLLSCYGHYDDK